MRRLTLVLSDLYLPDEAEPMSVDAATLPHLEWLLSLAGQRQHAPDWRAQLLADIGRHDLLHLPPAQIAAHGRLTEPQAKGSWLAIPIHLEARLDHVLMKPRGLLALAAEERAAWCDEFARAFGPELRLHDAGPGAFLLIGLPTLDARTLDPARFLGADIAKGLPTGPDANVLRRLGAEIEMWAHGAALNRERERRRQPPVSGLWLWGGSALNNEVRAAGPTPSLALAGEDAWLSGLSRLLQGQDPQPLPQGLESFQPDAEHRIAVLAPMTGAGQSLDGLDTHWFGPASRAMKQGELGEIRLFANDRLFRVVNRDRMKFWRRRQRWLDSLRHASKRAKA